jgi:hypothetical protein
VTATWLWWWTTGYASPPEEGARAIGDRLVS